MMLAERVLNRFGRPFGIKPSVHAFPNPIAAHYGSPAAVTGEMHRANFWCSRKSLSGLAFIATYRRGRAGCLVTYGIRPLFGAPCGDLNGVSVFLTEHPGAYAGGHNSLHYVWLWSRDQIARALEMAQVP